jgi:holin-like protein
MEGGGMLGAFAWLLLFQFAGELVVRGTQLPVPGPVMGMVLLLVALMLRGSAPVNLRATAEGLIQHLMLLVLPSTAGLVLQLDRLTQEWLPLTAAVVGGAVLTIAATALTLRAVLSCPGKPIR